MTLAAAIEPARRAGRIPPVEALKARLDLPPTRRARLRWLVAVFALVGVVGLVVWPRGAGDGALVRALAVYAVLLVVVPRRPVRAAGARPGRRRCPSRSSAASRSDSRAPRSCATAVGRP